MGRVLVFLWIFMTVINFFGIIQDLIKGENILLNSLGLSFCIFLFIDVKETK